MTKKRPRRRPRPTGSSSARGPTRRWEQDIAVLLAQFVWFRGESVSLMRALEEADHVEPLLVLKVRGLEEPDLAYWTEEMIRRLLLEMVPRYVMQPREMVMEQIPALGEFFAFLASRGRWLRKNMELGEARALLDDLVLPVLEAVEDPSRTSEPENVLAYAATLGVGPEDAEAFAQFLVHYNGHLTPEERRQICDTGRLDAPPDQE